MHDCMDIYDRSPWLASKSRFSLRWEAGAHGTHVADVEGVSQYSLRVPGGSPRPRVQCHPTLCTSCCSPRLQLSKSNQVRVAEGGEEIQVDLGERRRLHLHFSRKGTLRCCLGCSLTRLEGKQLVVKLNVAPGIQLGMLGRCARTTSGT